MLQSLASNSCVRLIQSHKSTWYFASLVLGYLLYLVFGAVVFSSVELPYEDLLRQELRAIKKQFLQENECLSEERLERFLKKALEASNYGVSILNNASANWNWDFTSALFFASTVLSTTGKRWSPPLHSRWCCSRPGAQDEIEHIYAFNQLWALVLAFPLSAFYHVNKNILLSDLQGTWVAQVRPHKPVACWMLNVTIGRQAGRQAVEAKNVPCRMW